MSDTAAVAACTASETLICGSFSDSGVLSLGNSTSTSPSQNAKRSRKNILRSWPSPKVPGGRSSATGLHPAIVDKSQVIEAGLIRRKIVEHLLGAISRK